MMWVMLIVVALCGWLRAELPDSQSWTHTGEHTFRGNVHLDGSLYRSGTLLDLSAEELLRLDRQTYMTWFEDFLFVPMDSSTNTLGWTASGDAEGFGLQLAGVSGTNGVYHLYSNTNVNDEAYRQLGALGVCAVVLATNDGKKITFEARVQQTDITKSNAVFVGLAQAGAAAADFLVDTTGVPATNKSYVGFWASSTNGTSGTGTWWRAVWSVANRSGFSQIANVCSNEEGMVTLRMEFDGVDRWTVYGNGDPAASQVIWTNGVAPISTALQPILAVKALDRYVPASWRTDPSIKVDYLMLQKQR
jgi:hypothetical protein